MRKSAVFIALLGGFLLAAANHPAAQGQQQRNSGVSTECGEFTVGLDLFFVTIGFDRPDEGWAWVDRTQRIKQATGIARNVHVAATDTPANHESHDADFELELDLVPDQEGLLSFNDHLGIEWESGIRPSEHFGDGASPIFPKWAWPSEGDRVWVEGHWIHDCGHPESGLYHTEIHPPRAIATMREQAAPVPGTGLTPVPVTLTDLYITGRGGYVTEQLNCGVQIILGDHGDTCGQDPPPADDSFKTTPINKNFTFNICLPPRPPNTVLSTREDLGPRNTVSIAPLLEFTEPATAPCVGDLRFDQSSMLAVTVPLLGTATPPDAIYARHIYAGWVTAPNPVLPQRRVTLNSTNLHEDHDPPFFDGELTFWFVNLNRASPPWLRLSDFADGNMNSYDDDDQLGDGEMSYTGASFVDFYLRQDGDFSVRSRGYEQDCFDTFGGFGVNELSLFMYVVCYADLPNFGAGDPIANADGTFFNDDVGNKTIAGGSEYELRLTIDELPLGFEDTSYLSIDTSCTPAGEVALVGQPLTCATRVDNAGPGLPRNVKVNNRFSVVPVSNPSGTWEISGNFGDGTHPCAAAGSEVTCAPTSVPVAAATPVNITTTTTPTATGILTERAEVTTLSSDPILTDNVDTTTIEVFMSVTADVSPRDPTNVVNLKRGGTVAVAILTTETFDATTVDPSTVCFGDAGSPTERSCTERHATGHLEDVNRDKRRDLLLHYEVSSTGIDSGDTQACLIGRTFAGVGVYACDVIVTFIK